MDSFFKKCSFGSVWKTRDDFLSDPAISLVGYQADFEDLALGLLLFNHAVSKTTLAIEADRFLDLHNGPIFKEQATGTEGGPGFCLRRNNPESCPAVCECVYIREILQVIRRRKAPKDRCQ